jgi:hypothetical protein
MQKGETVERSGQCRESQVVAANLHARGIPAPATVKPSHFENGANDRWCCIPVLGVEEIQSLPEYLGFVISLNSKALARVDGS